MTGKKTMTEIPRLKISNQV